MISEEAHQFFIHSFIWFTTVIFAIIAIRVVNAYFSKLAKAEPLIEKAVKQEAEKWKSTITYKDWVISELERKNRQLKEESQTQRTQIEACKTTIETLKNKCSQYYIYTHDLKSKIDNQNGQIHRLKTYQTQIQTLKKHFKDKKVILDKTQFQSLLKVAPHNCVEQPKATTEK
jgi:predicted RNase H-like nuclease (RuvC/YqgF family)